MQYTKFKKTYPLYPISLSVNLLPANPGVLKEKME
jgi:hypothetical protein